jgi:hypothetical protein
MATANGEREWTRIGTTKEGGIAAKTCRAVARRRRKAQKAQKEEGYEIAAKERRERKIDEPRMDPPPLRYGATGYGFTRMGIKNYSVA